MLSNHLILCCPLLLPQFFPASMNFSKTPGHEFGQTPGDSGGQRSLVCCTPWGCKELAMTERLNNINNKAFLRSFTMQIRSKEKNKHHLVTPRV